jgi:hypothetical protein
MELGEKMLMILSLGLNDILKKIMKEKKILFTMH